MLFQIPQVPLQRPLPAAGDQHSLHCIRAGHLCRLLGVRLGASLQPGARARRRQQPLPLPLLPFGAPPAAHAPALGWRQQPCGSLPLPSCTASAQECRPALPLPPPCPCCSAAASWSSSRRPAFMRSRRPCSLGPRRVLGLACWCAGLANRAQAAGAVQRRSGAAAGRGWPESLPVNYNPPITAEPGNAVHRPRLCGVWHGLWQPSCPGGCGI